MAKIVKVIFSDKYKAKMSRIRRLPVFMEKAVSGLTKKDLISINKIFHDGIKLKDCVSGKIKYKCSDVFIIFIALFWMQRR